MKKEKQPKHFDWSRNPSREGIHSVYIATPGSDARYGKDITKEEMANAIANWNKFNDLKEKKAMFRTLFLATLVSIPFLAIIYNMISTIIEH